MNFAGLGLESRAATPSWRGQCYKIKAVHIKMDIFNTRERWKYLATLFMRSHLENWCNGTVRNINVEYKSILKLSLQGSPGKFDKRSSVIALTPGYQTVLSSMLRSAEIQTVSIHMNTFFLYKKSGYKAMCHVAP